MMWGVIGGPMGPYDVVIVPPRSIASVVSYDCSQIIV